MSKFTNLALDTLYERLGAPAGKTMQLSRSSHRHSFHMFWFCDGPGARPCVAFAQAGDTPMPPGLTPLEQEMFDHADFPKSGWTLNPCPRHESDFPVT